MQIPNERFCAQNDALKLKKPFLQLHTPALSFASALSVQPLSLIQKNRHQRAGVQSVNITQALLHTWLRNARWSFK